jgi:peroxiredoxin (alkyl hydroperoxide reductase subunit C)
VAVQISTQAPSVEVEAYVRGANTPVLLDPVLGDGRWTVLFFYPRDFTSCPTELLAFEDLREAFAAEGAEVMAASTDSWWVHRAWLGSDARLAEIRYPVLADPARRLATAYGVLAGDGCCERATVILDPEGIVRSVSVTDGSVGRSAEETLRVLQALRTGELRPASWRPGRPILLAA